MIGTRLEQFPARATTRCHLWLRRFYGLGILVAGCTVGGPSSGLADIDVGLPMRTQAPDLSRMNDSVILSGANVFVTLTGKPTPAALTILERAGLGAPKGMPAQGGIVTFDELRLSTVWAWMSPRHLKNVAALPWVVRVEPSGGDPIGF